MNPILLAFVPFYWLRAGPEFLLVVQVAAQASGAVAVYLLARDRLADRWLALVLAGVLLLNPTYQFLTWEFFHPDALAVAPLLFAYWAARLRALAVVRGRGRAWRWPARRTWHWSSPVSDSSFGSGATAATGRAPRSAAVAWFLLSTRLLMRRALGGLDPFYDAFFPRARPQRRRGVVRSPSPVPGGCSTSPPGPTASPTTGMILAPFAFLPLAEPPTMALFAGPSWPSTRSPPPPTPGTTATTTAPWSSPA